MVAVRIALPLSLSLSDSFSLFAQPLCVFGLFFGQIVGNMESSHEMVCNTDYAQATLNPVHMMFCVSCVTSAGNYAFRKLLPMPLNAR